MNKTTKKPGKRLSAVQVPFYHGIHLHPSECGCFYLGISVPEISAG